MAASRPAALAAYIATSARVSSSARVSPGAATAMPTLALTRSTSPSTTAGIRSAASTRTAVTLAASASVRTTNSSPPRRATVPVAPATRSSRSRTCRSRRSPTSWPWVSFTCLNSSMSMSRTLGAAEGDAWAKTRARPRRFARSVSGSWSARCSLALSAPEARTRDSPDTTDPARSSTQLGRPREPVTSATHHSATGTTTRGSRPSSDVEPGRRRASVLRSKVVTIEGCSAPTPNSSTHSTPSAWVGSPGRATRRPCSAEERSYTVVRTAPTRSR